MSANLIIVFREALEIFIITGMVAAATKGLQGRNKYIFAGLALGFVASAIVGVFANQVTGFANDIGEKLFHGIILLTAASLIAYTVVWMQNHAKQFKEKLQTTGEQIKAGTKTKFTITLIVFLAVLREGSEIVFLTYTELTKGTAESVIIRDSIIGLISGFTVGAIIYFGLIKLPLKYIFKTMNILLTLLAAGLAASGVKKLYDGGFIDFLSTQTWNLQNSFLTESQSFGKILHIMFGWDDNPILLQIVVYALVVAIVVALRRQPKPKKVKTLNPQTT